jgi:alpha-beta hydrolase superfamily lysophospholipase
MSGEVPALLLQAVKKHITASDRSAAAQRFMTHPGATSGGRINMITWLPDRVPKPTRGSIT